MREENSPESPQSGKGGQKEVQSVRELFEACMQAFRSPAFLLKNENNVLSANESFAKLVPGASLQSEPPLQTLFPDKDIRFLGDPEAGGGSARGSELAVEKVASWKNVALCRLSLGFSHDAMSEEALHSQRLITLGMLAGGVAHDFNNILAGILGHTTYLKTVLGTQGQHDESLAAVEDGARKAAGLTQQILELSRMRSEQEDEEIGLGSLLLSTTKLLRAALSPRLRVELDLGVEEAYVLGKESRLSQVIANVVMNARDAEPKDSCIHVCMRCDLLPMDLSGENWACVVVRDSGEGMTADVLARAFEPYFSTKDSKGTGLGLATVRAVLNSIGGQVQVKSERGVGTEVYLYFPVVRRVIRDPAEKSPSTKKLTPAPEPRPSQGIRLLIIDDEDTVRNVLGMSLRHLGFDVLLARSGEEALQILRTSASPIDLVLLDMLMPGMGGEEVFAKLQEVTPGLAVCVMSGYSSEQAVKNILRQGGKGFIQKPFTIEQLSEKISEILPKPKTQQPGKSSPGKVSDGGSI